MEEKAQNFLSQTQNQGILWIPSITNIFPLLGQNNQGGYGVVCKV
jgi:hypothetical protein